MRSLLPLGVDITGLALDTAVAAYLLDPSVDRYRLGDLAARYLGVAVDDGTGGQGPGDLRPRRAAGPGPGATTAWARTPCGRSASTAVLARLRPPLADALAAVGEDALYDDIEQPLVRVLARMEVVGIPVDRDVLRSIAAGLAEECAVAGADHPGPGRHPVQGELGAPAAHRALRDARASPRCARPRPGSRPTPGPSSCCATSTRSSRPCCATGRWRSCGPPTGRAWPPRWPPTAGSTPPSARPSPAPAGCRRTGPTCTTSRCAPRRAAGSARPSCPSAGRRLLVADYDQVELRAIAHLSGDPGLDRGLRRRRGHPPHGGVPGLRCRAGRGHPRPAVDGQDGLLRPGLRHGGLRAVPAPGRAGRGGPGHPPGLLRRLPVGARLHGAGGVRGPQRRLHGDRLRPAPAACPT